MERWKLIPDYDYSISDHGRVRNEQTGYISCGFKNKDGYVKVDLYRNSVKNRKAIHRLVAEAFLPPPTQKQLQWASRTKKKVVHINHKDCNRSNNHYLNLEWNTASENVLYSYSHGNATTNRGAAVLTWEIVREIRKDYNDNYNDVIEYARENCNKYRVCKKTIRRILYNQTWIED
ncbi:TPA: HNH endonuclease [Escherichia coli]|uniref:NUMOD4 domain-containing protein n=1 Tax=Escherichia coli TaxID=562 RepID=UPI001A640297|nr:HNH endonuclease [Escherichia coli]VVZ34031.1 NUMOD4 motif [Escherichia coli]HBB9485582.1 HNH endonuclease [Escherichia coli]HBC8455101.1 HNH endonuclease [Escherichia coli]HCJ9509904.1 HNH endonuclease [Escherichia coli]